MKIESIPNEKIVPGMTLYGWCESARRAQGNMADLQQGPSGIWHAMVVSNTLHADPLNHNARVHLFTVLFTNGSHTCLQSFFRNEGGNSSVIM